MNNKNHLKILKKANKIPSGNFPHYSLDGKARQGVLSENTGRTEMDLTIYNSDTSRVFAQKTLPDKEGESVAAEELINKIGTQIPEGIFTADAGITSPRVVAAIKNSKQHYILAIKSNAGKIYTQIKEYNWNSIKTTHVQYSEGHGRQEIRKLKKLDLIKLNSIEYNKYVGAKVAYKIETRIKYVKDDKFTYEDRFFIADDVVSELPLSQITNYIRKHWAQESYHWVKDVILEEDDCPHKNHNGSRILSILRSQVFTLSKKIIGSVKEFTTRFGSKPEVFLDPHEKK
jgi:predicted transposase YbfD/YdcC